MGATDCQSEMSWCRLAASVLLTIFSRKRLSLSISAISERISRCFCVAASGTSKKIKMPTGRSSGASKPMGLSQLKHRRHRCLETLDATMRDRHTMPQTGRAQAFTGEQAVSDQGPAQAMQVFEQQAGFFKRTFFAGNVNLNKHLRSGKDGRESIHDMA
jgi:hypothetical protein